MTTRPGGDANPRMTVILGPFSSEPFALGLRDLLVGSGYFDLVSFDDMDTLGRDAILIIEGSDPAQCLRYLDLAVVRCVVLFDPVGARAFVGLDNPDWRQLVTVVKAVADEMSVAPPAQPHDRVRLVDPRRLDPAWADGADSAALVPLRTWLELRLALGLLRRPGRDLSGVPGLSIGPREALDLLAVDRTATEATLELRLTAADEALIETRTTLPGALARIAAAFALSDLDLRMLCLILAPELDGRYATVIGVLQDDLTRRRPGLTLVADLLGRPGTDPWQLRRALGATDSLVAAGVAAHAGPGDVTMDAGLGPSRAVVLHLLIPSAEQAAAKAGAVLFPPSADETSLSPEESGLAQRLRHAITGPSPLLHLTGGRRAKDWFRRVASSLGLPLIAGDLERIEPGPDRAAAIADWGVLSRVTRSGLLVLGAGDDPGTGAQLSYLVGRAPLVATDLDPGIDIPTDVSRVVLAAPHVTAAQRAQRWTRAAARVGLELDAEDAERLAATAPADGPHIARAVSLAAGQAPGPGRPAVRLVQQASRDLLASAVPRGVRRITPVYSWDDIVLPEARKELLRSVAQHVVHAGRVLEDWGFGGRMPYGQGVAVLFSGPSGTGKTMAAQIIAGELGVDLFQVDLSKTISKYIGETEKNLDGIFDVAERTGAVLLFDEADAIFGRRTEIKDAHDRHANVEVAYLLQRIESFCGLAVLTTNVKQNIDDAFVRRLRFAVDFPLPDAADRTRIWRRAFPAGAPLAAGVDVSSLASRLQITGGSIQNIALHAAFLAAAESVPVSPGHLLTATRRELVKVGMLTAERSLDDRWLGAVS